jgi:hypothetical protein
MQNRKKIHMENMYTPIWSYLSPIASIAATSGTKQKNSGPVSMTAQVTGGCVHYLKSSYIRFKTNKKI